MEVCKGRLSIPSAKKQRRWDCGLFCPCSDAGFFTLRQHEECIARYVKCPLDPYLFFLEIIPKASLLLAMLQLGGLEPSAGGKNVGES